MKIEVLFPELCNLNGDISNIKYLQKEGYAFKNIYDLM